MERKEKVIIEERWLANRTIPAKLTPYRTISRFAFQEL